MQLHQIYSTSLALFTDLYQFSMAYGYWKLGKMDQESVFCMYFRQNPYQSGFTVACGLEQLIDYLQSIRFDDSDISYLSTLRGNDGKPLYDEGFLRFLEKFEFQCDIDAVPEGTVVFPHEPLVRVKGPLYQCQLIESPLLNIINFQSLIATKAARLSIAAGGDPILEFGMRRAQGIDGALSASRAAYIGGCTATSNVLAGKLFGIPVRGTHAHSWVMSFDSELESFMKFADVMPNNSIFLVDTYNTLEGVKKAIAAGNHLKSMGYKMAGIRLDSGDLAYLSAEARKMLDEAGFPDASIVASNDLDEYIITSLKNQQDAKIDIWGVGTKLVTGYDQPALGGVYKITALKNASGHWEHKIKLSEQALKISNPGILQIHRYFKDGEYIADMIVDELTGIASSPVMIDPMDNTRRKRFDGQTGFKPLLEPVFRKGKLVSPKYSIESMHLKTKAEIEMLHKSVKRFSNPHSYPVGLESNLHQLKTDLVLKMRQL